MAIPERLTISGTEFLQEKRLCDARPVYGVTLKNETDGTAVSKVFLYFRAHQSEWWLGPEVGGTEFVARATGSLFQVIPRIEELQWRVQIQAGIENDEVEWHDSEVQLDNTAEVTMTPWSLLCSFVMATSGLLWSFCGSLGGGKKGAAAAGEGIEGPTAIPQFSYDSNVHLCDSDLSAIMTYHTTCLVAQPSCCNCKAIIKPSKHPSSKCS